MSGRRLFWIVLPLLALALVGYSRYAADRWRASHQLGAVEASTRHVIQQGLLARQPVDPRVRRLLESNAALMREAAELDPVEVGIPIARGSLYRLLDRPSAAIRAYREALTLEPRAEIYANLGRAHLQEGDLEAARGAFRKAVRLNHNFAKDFRPYLRDADEPEERTGADRPQRRRAKGQRRAPKKPAGEDGG